MKIVYCSQPTENTPGAARVAHLLAERVGDTVARLHLTENRAPRLPIRTEQRRGKPAPDATEGMPADDLSTDVETAAPTGAPRSPGAARATPACTRLIVAPRLAGRTHADADETERLALTTRVPTLVAHDPSRILTWLGGGRVLRVLCAHDLTATADDALRFVKQLSQVAPCEVIVAHVHRSVEELSHPGCANVGSMRQHDLEMRRLLEAKIRERVRNVMGDRFFGIRVSPAPFRRDDFILEVIREVDADLVVTAIHPQLRSDVATLRTTAARTLLCFAATNVVVVPAGLAPVTRPKQAIRRVLVATDLDAEGNRALAHGQALLGDGGTLRLLHVMHPQARPDSDNDRNLNARERRQAHARLVESNGRRLRALVPPPADANGIVFETEIVEHHDRVRAIAHAAERFDADIVCLVMHERPSFLTRLFRCQIRRILARANRPLLILQSARS
jgi:nucleotide-binding universal stress UspA family protein